MPPDILRQAYYPNLQPTFPAEEVRRRIEGTKRETVLDVDHLLRTLKIDAPEHVSISALQEAYWRGKNVYAGPVLERINSFAKETFDGIKKRSDLYVAAAGLDDAFPEYLAWLRKNMGEDDSYVYQFRRYSCPHQWYEMNVPIHQPLFELGVDNEHYTFQLENFNNYCREQRGIDGVGGKFLTVRHATDPSKTFHLEGRDFNGHVSRLSYVADPEGKIPDALERESDRIREDLRRHIPEEKLKEYATGYIPKTFRKRMGEVWDDIRYIFR